jgi:hypothetical protein
MGITAYTSNNTHFIPVVVVSTRMDMQFPLKFDSPDDSQILAFFG